MERDTDGFPIVAGGLRWPYRECPDCNGTGREQMPCDQEDEYCEFCGGTGEFNRDGEDD